MGTPETDTDLSWGGDQVISSKRVISKWDFSMGGCTCTCMDLPGKDGISDREYPHQCYTAEQTR
jgi:hypothetical protein